MNECFLFQLNWNTVDNKHDKLHRYNCSKCLIYRLCASASGSRRTTNLHLRGIRSVHLLLLHYFPNVLKKVSKKEHRNSNRKRCTPKAKATMNPLSPDHRFISGRENDFTLSHRLYSGSEKWLIPSHQLNGG